ncbi:MAG: type II secretion system inner membrane protein GspF [bacterium]
MAAFHYEAIDAKGRTRKGVLSADSQRLARQELKKTGLTPIQLEPVTAQNDKKSSAKSKLKESDIVLATRQIATLVDTATPVEEALQAVAMEMDRPAMRSTLLAVRARVMEGWCLSDALAEFPRSFSPLYRGIVASGEASGEFGAVLSRLAEMLEKNRAIRLKALTAMIYPLLLFVVTVMVVSGLMIFVIPRIVEQFDTMGAQLPLITRFIIGVSNFLVAWGAWLLVALIAVIIGFSQALRVPAFKLAVDRFILQLPVIGSLARQLDAARFSRTLATLTAAGSPLLDSLQAARRTVMNADIHARLGEALIAVREGVPLSMALRKSAAFPAMMTYMVAAGERSGEMASMLDKTAQNMETDFDTVITLALRLIEPLIIVVMGIIVLLIVLAIMVPILQINTLTVA